MTRGRPIGSRKRAHAVAAADAIRDGRFDDIRTAAAHYRPPHVGSEEGFRNFVDYVEEELRRLPRTIRTLRILSRRTRNRLVQPSERAKRRAALKHQFETIPAVDLRREILSIDPYFFTPVSTDPAN